MNDLNANHGVNLAWFRFYEELNDFLPSARKKKLFPYSFTGNPSVKDAIEALGIPHVEVDMILVNSNSVGFGYRLQSNDYVSVYPVFESLDISNLARLRDKPLRNLKFAADVHLGKLVKLTRLCGFDTYYRKDIIDKDLITLALYEARIILTRDKGLLKNKQVTHGYWIRSQNPDKQLTEIINRFDLKDQINLFTRCMECNGILSGVPKEDILDRLLPKTRQYYHDFKICGDCRRIYWEGSHYDRMRRHLEELSLYDVHNK